MFNKKIKFSAFTLAEMLIVISIIGTIATLTIPNLINYSADNEKVTRLKITYSTLNEAFQRATAKYGSPNNWCADVTDSSICELRFTNNIVKNLNISKDCLDDKTNQANTGGCFTNKYQNQKLYYKMEFQ